MRDGLPITPERPATTRGTASLLREYYDDENEADYDDGDDGDEDGEGDGIAPPRETRVRRGRVEWCPGW
jgi:hypothetical protein